MYLWTTNETALHSTHSFGYGRRVESGSTTCTWLLCRSDTVYDAVPQAMQKEVCEECASMFHILMGKDMQNSDYDVKLEQVLQESAPTIYDVQKLLRDAIASVVYDHNPEIDFCLLPV